MPPITAIRPVYLVGAGPGDPDLLTVKAQRLLGEADVVVYDRLVSSAVLDLIPAGVSRIYVGKATQQHSMVQEEINALLVKLARSGRTVVRLKGGDPFVFGRGSEEADFLARHGVPFEVVPGITAASGCLAALGIPLTHRSVASGVRFVTGHSCQGKDLDLNWASLADPDTTLVVYMGLANIGVISTRLIESGLPPDTPAVAIAHGTTPQQKTCCATVASLPGRLAAEGIAAPVLIVIGRVVALADRWARPWTLGEAARADTQTPGRGRA
ncbi:MAG: uroporphyrinogen-III C-methyltransferase [Alphaproteobacteria bacterium]